MIWFLAAGEERQLPVRGLFYGIGHQPNSHLVEGHVDLDEKGYVKVSALPVILINIRGEVPLS